MKAIVEMMTSLFLLSVTIWSGAQYRRATPLQNVVLTLEVLHTGGGIYKMLKSTHLVKLIGNGRHFQGKEIKNGRPRRLAEKIKS